jgi:hypothetical protein
LLGDEFSVQEESNHPPSETFAHGGRIPEGDVEEMAIGIETAFQDDSVDMRVQSGSFVAHVQGVDIHDIVVFKGAVAPERPQ